MADEELKRMMEINTELVKENNKLLKKIRGATKRAIVFKIIYWLIILGIALGAFYYIQPFVDKAKEILGTVSGIGSSIPDIGGLLDQVNGKK
ncbi:hypothetical protein A2645_00585 [Candidatus Nomurabacteria bacterium RIFCSPHIGHO2_01_FULL_39_9]|uniref:Uncharacterized protein n=1 Tax=Candidatus Nomurabacteria bacterium RIFCSPHIGHO2_01_FULL_39_9 TaxID=1801735 RepID=A0A1F6UWJ3_9BACT|nr:MAG: hypothetical protein A2645_00585 [Candidatus Nomurabacteria bacterium RIFCSPHIGHO2_01_FULL_39_9]